MTMIAMVTAALLTGAPASAQTAPAAAVVPATPPPTTAAIPSPPPIFAVPPIPPTEPARLAAARPVIDRLWPIGSYARLMRTMMGPFMQASMAQTFNMKPGELLAGLAPQGMPPRDKPEETLGQMAAKNDPYFQQRMARTMDVLGDEMGKLMTGVEPGIRDAVAHAYARRFTVAELHDLDRFLATPTGAAYASDWMTVMLSPDMAQAMRDFVPEMVKAMPAIMARVAAATKDLPPPGKPGAPSLVVPPPLVVPPVAVKPQ